MKIFSPLEPKCIVAIAAHADDIDFTAAGSLAKYIHNGTTVHYVVLTDGSRGTNNDNDIVKTRQAEQRAACAEIGVTEVHFLNRPDGQLIADDDLKREIVAIIRTVKPDTVVTTDPATLYDAETGSINHIDHRNAGQATLDAVYPLARNAPAYPDLLQQGLQPHKVKTMLLTMSTTPNYYEDISDHLKLKLRTLRHHASQLSETSDIEQMLEHQAKQAGEASGHTYAEAFTRIDIWPQ